MGETQKKSIKYIFYVHSHINYYICKSVQAELRLIDENIIYIISRNYTNTFFDSCNVIDLSEEHDALDDFSVFNFWSKHKYIKKIDLNIQKHVSEHGEFVVFLPHVFHPIMQIIATSKNCIGLHIIEEGLNAYSDYYQNSKERSFIRGLVKRVANRIHFIGRGRVYFVKPFDLRKFEKTKPPIFYTIGEKGFRRILYTRKVVNFFREANFSYNVSNKFVLILEGAVEQGNLGLQTLLEGIKYIANQITAQQIYIKYHPAQSDINIKKINSIFLELGIKVHVIPSDLPFEQIAINSKNVTVLGFASSLLYYSKIFGCKVISYEELLLTDKTFQIFRNKNNFDLKTLLNQ